MELLEEAVLLQQVHIATLIHPTLRQTSGTDEPLVRRPAVQIVKIVGVMLCAFRHIDKGWSTEV